MSAFSYGHKDVIKIVFWNTSGSQHYQVIFSTEKTLFIRLMANWVSPCVCCIQKSDTKSRQVVKMLCWHWPQKVHAVPKDSSCCWLYDVCFCVYCFPSCSVSFIRKDNEKKPNSLKEEEVYADLMLVSSRVCNSESPPNPRIGFISKKTTQSLDIYIRLPSSSSSSLLYYILR